MPWYTNGGVGPEPQRVGLDDFPSSLGASVRAAVDDAWVGNPTIVARDYFRARAANDGQRLDRSTAEKRVREAGLKLNIPEDGYTADALDLIIERKQEELRRQDVLSRAPAGFVPTTTRFAAQLATSIADPLGLVASFVPVVSGARYTMMLARAGESAASRGLTRAGVGAVEGAVGAAVLEPAVLYGRTQLQDDYGMADSLLNLAFGAAMGGALHPAAGALSDAFRGTARFQRFAGLSVEDVRTVMNFDRERSAMPAADVERVMATYTPEMRRAVDPLAPATEAPRAPPADAYSAIDARISPEIREVAVRSAVADMVRGRIPDVDTILRLDPAHTPNAKLSTLGQVRATAERQAGNGASMLVDSDVRPSATQEGSNRSPDLRGVAPQVDQAIERLTRATERAQLPEATSALRPWDDAIADAVNLRQAARAAALCGL